MVVQGSTQAATMCIHCTAADIPRDLGAGEGDVREQQGYKREKYNHARYKLLEEGEQTKLDESGLIFSPFLLVEHQKCEPWTFFTGKLNSYPSDVDQNYLFQLF